MSDVKGQEEFSWSPEAAKAPSSSGADLNFDADESSLKEQVRERYRQNTRYRRIFSWWVIGVVSAWLLAAMVAVYLQGFGVFKMDGWTFRVFLATTTVNVIGLAYIVLKGMFPQDRK
jgi:magnesium-transporting ATPase (P-type)